MPPQKEELGTGSKHGGMLWAVSWGWEGCSGVTGSLTYSQLAEANFSTQNGSGLGRMNVLAIGEFRLAGGPRISSETVPFFLAS